MFNSPGRVLYEKAQTLNTQLSMPWEVLDNEQKEYWEELADSVVQFLCNDLLRRREDSIVDRFMKSIEDL